MHTSSVLVAALAAVSVLAAPAYPAVAHSTMPGALNSVSEYFNLLAKTVKETRQTSTTSVCDLTKAALPTNAIAPALPPPSAGMTLKHVAIGRGTQNYTCDTTNSTAAPVANGALATLFNATCLAATYPALLDMLPRVVLSFNLSDNTLAAVGTRLYPSNLAVSGHHYFTTATTPFFNLDIPAGLQVGEVACAKNSSQSAPSSSTSTASTAGVSGAAATNSDNRGQNGEAAVPWLKLLAKPGQALSTTGGLQEVYRVVTAGGSAPATCAGMPASFEVQYAAQYWFYEDTTSS